MITTAARATQLPLVHCVESDDVYLRGRPDVLWFTLLSSVDWGQEFAATGAQYYEALWQFNAAQTRAQAEQAAKRAAANPETKREATTRLLFDRATMREEAPILAEDPPEDLPLIHVDPAALAPGVVPARLAGRAPKCFFAMFSAFVAVAVKGRAPEPEAVSEELRDNPSFARACGFTLPDPAVGYRQSDVPSLRKLEQFDQIMTDRGLWDQAAVQRVAANLKAKIVEVRSALVHDTTHFHAESTRTAVDLPEAHGKEAGNALSVDASDSSTKKSTQVPEAKIASGVEGATNAASAKEDAPAVKIGKGEKQKKRKSQSRTTKNCRCEDRATCPHEWVLADPGAGTVVKAGGKMHWAHKASTLTFVGGEGVLLDAVALTDAASHDSKSLVPHLARVFERHPKLKGIVNRVLDDSAADDAALKAAVLNDFSIELLTKPNPRGRKPMTTDLPRGIDHLTNLGVPVCRAGFPFDFIGCRHEEKRFLFQAPDAPTEKEADVGPGAQGAIFSSETAQPICAGCPLKGECCRDGAQRRNVSIPFDRLPWIDPAFPQLSIRFEKEMAQRTVIERLHKLMKDDFGDENLTKRGTKAFQARLDKTKLAMHLVLALSAESS